MPFFVIGLALTGGLATAQPAMAPQRDVAITYRNGPAIPGLGEVTTRELIQAGTLRTRNENGSAVMVREQGGRRVWTWDTAARGPARMVTERVVPETEREVGFDEMARDPDFQVTREGEERIAGLGCTRWRIRLKSDPETDDTLACLTPDGLQLRLIVSAAGQHTTQEALRVEYGPLDATLFQPAPNWPVRRGDP